MQDNQTEFTKAIKAQVKRLDTKKSVNPITTRNKVPEWEISYGSKIQSEHPPFRKIKFPHLDQPIDAVPYKIVNEDDYMNIKNIVL